MVLYQACGLLKGGFQVRKEGVLFTIDLCEHLSTWRQILIGPYAKLDPSVPSGFVLRLSS